MYKGILSLLGLAQKAGRLSSGDFGAEKAIRDGKAKLILMAEDCADEKGRGLCARREGGVSLLGADEHCSGKGGRR